MFLNALLDFFSLASFLPLVFLLVNPNGFSSNSVLSGIYVYFNFQRPSSFIILITVFVLVFTVIKNMIGLWIIKRKAGYTYTLGSELSSRMLSRYMEVSYLKFAQMDFSKELNRIASLPIAFANNIVLPLATLVSEGIVFLLLLAGVIFYDFKIFAVLGIILIPISVVYWRKRKTLYATSQGLKADYPLTLKYALQVVEGLPEMRVLGKESFFKRRFAATSKDLAKALTSDHIMQTGTSRFTEVIAAIIICSLIIYSVLTSQNYQHTILLLGVYAAASFRIIPSINRMLNASLQIKTHEYLFQELKDLARYHPQGSSPQDSIPRFMKTIELQNIGYQYPNGGKILQNISLTIKKGDKIAIIGRSGSGKTTLLLILLQLLDDHEGLMLIDQEVIQPISKKGLNRLFSYVPQDPYILDGTILENIAFGQETSEIDAEKIKQLIISLDLSGMIDQLPFGLETAVGERGIKLSGGQRQRIAIARALYYDAEILLLDEITNQLDTETEKEILITLEKVTQQSKTILMITHHTDLLNRFSRVLQLENGQLRELTFEKSSM